MASEENVLKENTEKKNDDKKIRNTVLDNFRKLTHNKEKIRLKSSIALLKHISENKDTENGKNELKYALGRLIRGLGASKNTSKIGFYTFLVALLNCVDEISISEIFDYVKAELHSSGSNSKSENADVFAGQILLYGALVRSGLYQNATVDEKRYILEQLLLAGKKRDYLFLSSVTFIIELCEKMNEKDFELIAWPILKPEIQKPWSEQNIDILYLLCSLRNQHGRVVNKKFMRNVLRNDEIHCKGNLENLANILLNIPKITVANHPFYEVVCKELSKENLSVDFLNEIDKITSKYNYNRHLIASMIITYLIKNIKDMNIIPDSLNKNYVQHTLQYFKTVKSSKNLETLQEVIYNLFDTIVEVLKKDGTKSDVKVEVIKKLLLYPGIFIFEKITRSKIIQHIIATLDFDGVEKLAELYRGVISGGNYRFIKDDEKQSCWNNDRVYASQLLMKLLTHPSTNEKNDWKTEQLKFLLGLSLFKTEDQNIGLELSASLKETFYRALALKLPKLKDLRSLLSSLVDEINNHINKDMRYPLTAEALETWTKSLVLIRKLESKQKKVYVVFHTLFLHMSLQLFNDVKLAADSLKELFSCYERVRAEKKHFEATNVDDPLWIEVVIDLFLNLLSHNSYLLRNLINCVFPHLCKYMNPTAMQQILDILDLKNEGNPLMPSDDSESDKGDISSESDEESEVSEGDYDGDEDIDDKVNDKLKMAVHMALGVCKSDEESIDLDDINEDEGKRLDEALATAFKQFKPNVGKKSNKQKKEDEALTHFRVRVLDLIESYLSSEPSMYLCLEIMVVLLRSLEFAIKDQHQKPLSNRIRSCLKKLSNVKKFGSIEDVDDTTLSDLFDSLLEKGTKNYFVMQEMNDKISECCLFVLRCSEYLDSVEEVPKKVKKHLKKAIIKTVTESLDMYFTKRECFVPYSLFKGIMQSCWVGTYKLFPSILRYSFADIRGFRRNQALELAQIFFGNHRLLATCTAREELDGSLEKFSENILSFLNNPEEIKVKEKFIRELMKTLVVLKRSVLNQEKINWIEMGIRLKEFRASFVFSKESKIAYNKLCRILSIDGAVVLKKDLIKLGNTETEKSDDEAEIVGDDAKVTQKEVKINKNGKLKGGKRKMAKLKKETQMSRMQSLSQGFLIDFTEADLKNERLESENEVGIENPKKRLKIDEEEVVTEDLAEVEENGELNDVNDSLENRKVTKNKKQKAGNMKVNGKSEENLNEIGISSKKRELEKMVSLKTQNKKKKLKS